MLCGLLFIMPGLLWPTSPLSTFPSTHIHKGFKKPVAIVPMGIGHGAETNRLLLVVCVSSRLWLEKQAASTYVLSESYSPLWRSSPNNGREEKDLALPFLFSCPRFSRPELGGLFLFPHGRDFSSALSWVFSTDNKLDGQICQTGFGYIIESLRN